MEWHLAEDMAESLARIALRHPAPLVEAQAPTAVKAGGYIFGNGEIILFWGSLHICGKPFIYLERIDWGVADMSMTILK